MNANFKRRLSRLAVATGIAVALAAPAHADDTEIFFGLPPSGTSGSPNIMFIFDTSGSMSTQIVTQISFDPTQSYAGSCDASKIYWQSGTGATPPTCRSTNYVAIAQFQCKTAFPALGLPAVDPANPAVTTGHTTQTAAQWNSAHTTRRAAAPDWEALVASNRTDNWVDCQADSALTPPDGGTDTTKPYEANGATGPYTATAASQITWTSRPTNGTYTFSTGNYLNWYYNASSVTKTRLQTVQDSAKSLLAGLTGVNVGLMRYDDTGNGGMVLAPIAPLNATQLAVMNTAIDAMSTSGSTPLEATLYEAALYFRGGAVDYGRNSSPTASVTASRIGTGPGSHTYPNPNSDPNAAYYDSPFQSDCQKSFIVFLTDGLPNVDYSSESKILGLPGFTTTVTGTSASACGPNVPVDGTQSGTNLMSGRCFAPLAEYLYKTDNASGTYGTASVSGVQNISLYTIGFGTDVSGTTTLADAAHRGGGAYYTAGDTATLSTALEAIIRNILTQNTFFTSPTISVNAFNRTRNLNDLFITMFQSAGSYHWPGNLKKYHLQPDGTIVDNTGTPAVDLSTGFFRPTARSFWLDPAATADGGDVTLGGAANELPMPVARNLYTNLSLGSLTAPGNAIALINASLTAPMLGLAAGDLVGRAKMINFALGADVDGTDPTQPRFDMGDPLHSQPVTVIYGGTPSSPNIDDAAVMVATNDGYLHAFDPTSGAELWSFVPMELLNRINLLYQNNPITSKSYGLDGNLRVYKVDVNNDGVIDPSAGDKVYLIFGMGRGGSSYYCLDITSKTSPVLLWVDGPAQLPFVGQSWSTPDIVRMNIAGSAENAQQLVAVIGGGYDGSDDNAPYHADTVGNHIFFVDLLSGTLLWHAGPSGGHGGYDSTANLRLDNMTNSFPSDMRVIDLNGDGYADRMYAADTGGRLWRFDIFNGQPASTLVTGGVLASLGYADVASNGVAGTLGVDARKFYYAPDVSLLRANGTTFLQVAIGSGFRGHPLFVGDSTTTPATPSIQDYFWGIRDYNLAALPQSYWTSGGWSATTVLTNNSAFIDVAETTDVTTPVVPAGGPGWRMRLAPGEKVLAEARDFAGEEFFTTFTPNSGSSSSACTVTQGTNRLYVVNALTGGVVTNRDGTVRDSKQTDMPSSGIASNVVFVFPSSDNPATCTGATCRPDPVCLNGLLSCGALPALPPVRTFWSQQNVDD